MAKVRRTDDVDDFAVGHDYLKGTVYGPEKFLDEKQKPFRRMNHEEYLKYDKKVDESQGFDVDGCTGGMTGRISPLSRGGREWERAETVAKYAGWKQGEAMGIIIEFVRLVKANIQCVAGAIYYVTFVATTKDKTEKTFRAKVWRRPITWECKILLFLEGSDGKKDITVRTKAPGKRKRVTEEEEYITFTLQAYCVPVDETIEPDDTIAPDPKQLQKDACSLLAKKLKRQNPQWTDAQATSRASSSWERTKYPHKAPFLDEALKMFKRQYPEYYPNIK